MTWNFRSFFQGPQATPQEDPAVPVERIFANPTTSHDLRHEHVKTLQTAGSITEAQGHLVTRGLASHIPVGSVDDTSLKFIVEEVANAVSKGQAQAAAKGVAFNGKSVAEEAAADLAQRLNVPNHAEHFGITFTDSIILTDASTSADCLQQQLEGRSKRSGDPEASVSRGMRA